MWIGKLRKTDFLRLMFPLLRLPLLWLPVLFLKVHFQEIGPPLFPQNLVRLFVELLLGLELLGLLQQADQDWIIWQLIPNPGPEYFFLVQVE